MTDEHFGNEPTILPTHLVAEPDSLEAGMAIAFSESSAVQTPRSPSVLESIERISRQRPSVLLRDSAAEGESDPCVIAGPAKSIENDPNCRYRIDGEIARGGMGSILKGRDTDLGRDLAVKVLLESHRDRPEVVQRFVEEAQIGGQLQHPGIAPVYELGQFEDQRPFFTMKLVKGKTLGALLAERKSVTEDRSKLIGIFEQVCQTMAYAHSRGVIHRDLKPANIMVGAFGEVQVMDWGLAKVLKTGGVADESRPTNLPNNPSIIETLRSSGSDTPLGAGSQTQMGSVMGTPAYMPPEQALGEIDRLDERCDLFGLGAILCEILTGQPPYVADDNVELFRMATRGKLDDCNDRLDKSGSDEDLVAITRNCLSPDPKDRPLHAGILADRITEHIEAVEQRLRDSEVDRAAQTARVLEERKRRKASLMFSVAIALLIAALGGGGIWLQQQQTLAAETLAEKETERAEQQRKLKEQARELLYGSQMNVAANEIKAGQRNRAIEILDSQVAAGDDDLRGFEWHLLRRRCMEPVATIDLNWPQTIPFAQITRETHRPNFWGAVSGDLKVMARFPRDKNDEQHRVVLSKIRSQEIIGDHNVGYIGGVQSFSHAPEIALNADGTRFALRRGRKTLKADMSCEVEIWDSVAGEKLSTISVKPDYRVWRSVSFAFSPDSNRLAVIVGDLEQSAERYSRFCLNAKCEVFDVESATKVWSTGVADHLEVIRPVYSPDGSRIALLLRPNFFSFAEHLQENDWNAAVSSVVILDAQSGQRIETLEMPPYTMGRSIAFSPDGNKLAFASSDLSMSQPGSPGSKEDLLWIWDSLSLKKIVCKPIGLATATMQFSPDGSMLAATGWGGVNQAIVNVEDGSVLSRIHSNVAGITTFSTDSKYFEHLNGRGELTRWKIDRNPFRAGIFTLEEGKKGPGCVSGNGEVFARFDEVDFMNKPIVDSQIDVHSIDGTLIDSFDCRSALEDRFMVNDQRMLVLNHDGSRMAYIGLNQDGKKCVFAVQTKSNGEPKVLVELAEDEKPEHLFASRLGSSVGVTLRSPDNAKHVVMLWDLETDRSQTLRSPNAWTIRAALSDDGDLLAVAFKYPKDKKEEVRVYQTSDMKLLATHKSKFEKVLRLHYDKSGKRIAIAAKNPDQIVLWDYSEDDSVYIDCQWAHDGPYTLKPSLAFNQDGSRLFSTVASYTGYTLKIWNADSGSQVFTEYYSGLTNTAGMQLRFQDSSQRLIGWSLAGPPHIWNGSPLRNADFTQAP